MDKPSTFDNIPADLPKSQYEIVLWIIKAFAQVRENDFDRCCPLF